ncbi:polyprenyl synthetase family protein [bacterium]|nr:polyprenyl synthetase family protein [bacterium]
MISQTAEVRRKTFRESLLDTVQSKNEVLFKAAAHLLEVEGKSIRPRCARLIGEAANPDAPLTDAHERLAEAVEMLHVGSLIHDDILDEAELRRSVTSVHVKYGAKAAVLAGDFLLARSCGLIASLGHHRLNQRMAEVLAGLCEGEYVQDEQLWNLDVTVEAYLERMALKTSGPFELACEGAALLSGQRDEVVQAARRFGYHLGLLFQMFDDLLDYASSAEVAGKPVGQDLLAGSLTLPVIVALEDPTVGPVMRRMLTPFPQEIHQELKELLFSPEVFKKSLARLEAEARTARACLDLFPESASKDQLFEYLDKLSDQARSLSPEAALPTLGAAHVV